MNNIEEAMCEKRTLIKSRIRGQIAPSILACNPITIYDEVHEISKELKALHIDIMDAHFVPNVNGSPSIVKALKLAFPNVVLDIHLMVESPENILDSFIEAGADSITIHAEALAHPHRYLSYMQEKGIMSGLSLNPGTPVSQVKDLLSVTDMLLIMSVNPGFGGQKFIEHSYEKIREAKELIQAQNLDVLIEVDGGVKVHNANELKSTGADVLVAGSAIFGQANPLEELLKLQNS